MADSIVTWDLVARDRASSTFQRLGRESDTLLGKVKTLAGTVGLAGAGYAAVNFAKTSVRAFADAERSQNQLQDAYARFPTIASVQISALRDLNKTIQAKTGFDDDALASGEAVLAQFKLTGEQIKKTIPLVADYAARTGQDIPTAATNLGRAFLGNTRALKTLGINYKTTGDQAKDTANIIDLVRQKVGGFADREGKTAAGRARILATEFQNVEEQLGATLLPALTHLGNFLLHDVIPPLQKTADFLERNKRVIGPVTKTVLELAAAWKAYNIAAGIATRIGTGKAASAAAGGALASGASIARPVPVFVTNWKGGPGVVSTASKVETAAAEEATLRSRIGAALPKLGRNALRGFVIATLADALGSLLPSGPGGFVKTVGKGAGAGALFGPTGALIGGGATAAGIGVNHGLNALQSGLTPANAQSKVIAQLMANGQGQANLAKLQQIATRQMKETGRVVPEVQQEIDQLTAALRHHTTASHADKTATDNSTQAFHGQIKALKEAQSKAFDLSSGQDSLREAIHNMAVVAGGQSSRALKGNSDAALANRDAVRAAVGSAQDYLKILKDHGASAPHVADVELKLAKAIRRAAGDTYDNKAAIDALLGSLGFVPSEIQAIIDKYNELHAVWFDPTRGTGSSSPFRDPGHPGFVAANNDAKKAGGTLGKSLTNGYSAVVDSGVADASKKAADAAQAAFDKAKSKIQSDFGQVLDFFKSQKQQFISAADISNRTSPFEYQFGKVTPFLRATAKRMETFAKLYRRLDGKGLDPDLLVQFTGPEYIPAMRELLQSGRAGVNRANRLEHRIDAAGRTVAGISTGAEYGPKIAGLLDQIAKSNKHNPKMAKELERLTNRVEALAAEVRNAQHKHSSRAGH